MAFTQSDLDTVEAAILELATGQQVVKASVAGRDMQYTAAELDKLERLRSTIQAELGTIPLRTYAKQAGRAS